MILISARLHLAQNYLCAIHHQSSQIRNLVSQRERHLAERRGNLLYLIPRNFPNMSSISPNTPFVGAGTAGELNTEGPLNANHS